jgi:hypothetical protein
MCVCVCVCFSQRSAAEHRNTRIYVPGFSAVSTRRANSSTATKHPKRVRCETREEQRPRVGTQESARKRTTPDTLPPSCCCLRRASSSAESKGMSRRLCAELPWCTAHIHVRTHTHIFHIHRTQVEQNDEGSVNNYNGNMCTQKWLQYGE